MHQGDPGIITPATEVPASDWQQFLKVFEHSDARLIYMALKIVDDLTYMANYMLGRWDTAPDGLKCYLDEFEAFVSVWTAEIVDLIAIIAERSYRYWAN
jgi:hypothetical protein